jgi:hypothetical protein
VKIIWTEDFGNGQKPAPAPLTMVQPEKETMGEELFEDKPQPKETVKGFGLGK